MFIESICVKDGVAELLHYHQERMDRTYAYHFKQTNPYDLSQLISEVPAAGKFKLRVVYDQMIKKVSHALYILPDIHSLQIVESSSFDYSFKYADRRKLELLYENRGSRDDIIISMNQLVTDTFYANLVFWDGKNWFTTSFPLLQGVRRQHLLLRKQVQLAKIKTADIPSFKSVGLINAMLDLGEVVVDTDQVFL